MIASQFHSIGEGHEQDVSHFQQKETADEGKTIQHADLKCERVDLTLNKSESI